MLQDMKIKLNKNWEHLVTLLKRYIRQNWQQFITDTLTNNDVLNMKYIVYGVIPSHLINTIL